MVMPHSEPVHDEEFDYFAEVHDDTVDSESNSQDAEIDERKPSAKDMPHFESKHDNSPTDDDRKPAAKASISNNREIEAWEMPLFVQISQHNLVQATYIRIPGMLAHRNSPSKLY